MATDQIVLGCKTGVISYIVDFGFASKNENKDYCLKNTTGVCANDYNQPKLLKDLERCIGNTTCKFTRLQSYLTGSTTTTTTN